MAVFYEMPDDLNIQDSTGDSASTIIEAKLCNGQEVAHNKTI